MSNEYSEITPEIIEYAKELEEPIDAELYDRYRVNRGLRDLEGNGILTGLTKISEIMSYIQEGDQRIRCDGRLFFRGIDVKDLIEACVQENRFGFEEATYLLIFGHLPTKKQLKDFESLLAKYRTLPTNFVRDIVMKAPSKDIMNTLARSVLTLYSYDDNGSDTSIPNVLRQSIELIALFPALAVYAYQAYRHYMFGDSLFIHPPQENLSTAENILYMLRPDSKFTDFEAKVLDIALILHAEHGGGNNSTFTTHVVTSSGTDTYSSVAASLASLKGPKHGGANIKVVEMFNHLKENIKDWEDEEEIENYLERMLNGEVFDKKGLIYGMGHAIYSKSDPRAEILKQYVKGLAVEKGREDELKLYENVEKLAPKVISANRKMYKGVSANVDFYSGFIYNMLDLPEELYTPIFAIARISGWSAHRLEELLSGSKIIRPAYMNVQARQEYIPMEEREEIPIE